MFVAQKVSHAQAVSAACLARSAAQLSRPCPASMGPGFVLSALQGSWMHAVGTARVQVGSARGTQHSPPSHAEALSR